MADAETKEIDTSTEEGRRGAAGNRDWTKGSIVRNLLSLSWPMMINDGLRTVGPTIDMIWVGKLGAASVAGVGVGGMAVMAVMAGRLGISVGMRAMIARFVGQSDTKGANHIAQQALVISAAYALGLALIGILFAEQILIFLGVDADVVIEGAKYMRISFASTLVMSFMMVAEGIMQASGDAVTPMRITIVYRVFHVILCPFLIFGWWIFPRMGVSGAAITNVVAQILGMTLGLWVLFTGRSRLKLTLRNFRLDLNIIWRIVRIGIPAAIQMAQRSFAGLVYVWFMSPFGTYALAAHSLLNRIQMFVAMPSKGFSLGSSVLVGQNLGASQTGRAERSAWIAAGLAESAFVVFTAVILLWPGSIIRIFSSEPGVVEVGIVFLRIAVVGMLVAGFEMVIMDSLSGAGDTLPPMLFSVLTMWIVPVPLAFFLPKVGNLGVYGVRWAMMAGFVAGAIAYIIYFRLGRWKRKRV